MGHATLPIVTLTQAELDANTRPFGSRQMVFNTTTGELRYGKGLWKEMIPLGYRAHVDVVAATSSNITIATALNNGDTLDGVTLATDDLVLVKNQSTASQNGIYVVGASPARATAFDTFNEHVGKLVRIKGGNQAGQHFRCEVVSGGTLGSTAITFSKATIGELRKDSLFQAGELPVAGVLDDNDLMVIEDHLSGQLKHVALSTLKTYFNS